MSGFANLRLEIDRLVDCSVQAPLKSFWQAVGAKVVVQDGGARRSTISSYRHPKFWVSSVGSLHTGTGTEVLGAR